MTAAVFDLRARPHPLASPHVAGRCGSGGRAVVTTSSVRESIAS